jgi:hypothetical protein
MHNRRILEFEVFRDADFPLKDSITCEQFYLGTASFFISSFLFLVMATNDYENLLYSYDAFIVKFKDLF